MWNTRKWYIFVFLCVLFMFFVFWGGFGVVFFSHFQLSNFGLKSYLIGGVSRNGVICFRLVQRPIESPSETLPDRHIYFCHSYLVFHQKKFPDICLSVQIHTNHNLPPWKIPFNQLFFYSFHTFCSSLKYSLKENTERLFLFL